MILWWSGFEAGKLSAASRQAIANADAVFFSVASVWELEIKQSLGKLALPVDLWDRVESAGIRSLSIAQAEAITAARLPRHHGDPFDRMIIAHAIIHDIVLMTSDSRFAPYGVPILEV